MINIGKLRAASASYYLSAVAADQVGYYVGNGEAPGHWRGSLATELGLDGEVDAEGFQRLLAGLHPGTGEALLTAAGSNSRARARSDTHRAPRVDGASALDTAQVAAQLGVTDRAVQQWLKAGEELTTLLAAHVGCPITTSEEAATALAEVGVTSLGFKVPSSYLVGSRQPRPKSVVRGAPRWVVTQREVDRLAATRRSPTAQAGWDVVFRPPKSYSVLWAVGGSELGNEIKAIHHDAVTDALAYLEDAAATARTTADVGGGRQRVRVETTGFVAAAFDHRDSRAGDPLLHTHVVVANATRRPDGSWAALDPRGLYTHALAADGVYQATFRHLAERRLGIASEPVVNGWADARGVPRSVIEQFSKRSADIEAELARIGSQSASARQTAALATRQAKQPKEGVDLHERWRAEAAGIGFGAEQVEACLGNTTGTTVDRRTIEIVFANLAGPNGLTATAATFTRADVVSALAASLGGSVRGSDLAGLASEFCASDRALHIIESRPGHRRARILSLRGEWTTHLPDTAYTTPELAAMEAELIAWAAPTAGRPAPSVDPSIVAAVLGERPDMNEEQRHMVRAICGSEAFMRPVVGYPGSGKTYASEAVVTALVEAGTPVVGCAVTAEAADELARQTGLGHRRGTLGCDTVARVLGDLDDPEHGGLPIGAVVIIDEASTVPHRDLHRLAVHARRAGGALVLMGDPHQHGAVGPGNFFTWLASERPTVALVSNNRQRDGVEQLANIEYREGRIAESLARRDGAGRVTRSATASELYDQLVEDWFTDWQSGSRDPMIATRNAVREELSERARARLVEAGAVHGRVVYLNGRAFQVGDAIVTRRNNRRLQPSDTRAWYVKNGSRGTIVEIDAESGDLVVDFAGHQGLHRVRLPHRWAASSTGGTAHVEYGYAVTDYGVQGRSLGVARAVLDDATTSAGAYVASTRGRDANQLYLVEGHQADRGMDGDVVHDVVANSADRDLDVIAARLAGNEIEPLIHEIDPRSAAAGRLAATSTLQELEGRLAGVERRLSDAPPDVSRRIAGAERRRDELAAQRRVVQDELETAGLDRARDGLRNELHRIDEQLGALEARLAGLRVAELESLDYRERFAAVFERRDLLRAAVETRTTEVRLAAPATVGQLLPRARPGAARADRSLAREVAEELAVQADRRGISVSSALSVAELLGARPTDRDRAADWDRTASLVRQLDPDLVDAPIHSVELSLSP